MATLRRRATVLLRRGFTEVSESSNAVLADTCSPGSSGIAAVASPGLLQRGS